jgi:hypothetical protein
MPLTNGSGSCYFHHWPSRRQQKTNLTRSFSAYYFLYAHLHHVSKIKSPMEDTKLLDERRIRSWIRIDSSDGSGRSRNRVSGPHWINPDPDLAFFLIPDPGFDDLKLKKFIAENLISIFLIKNCILLIPRIHKGRPSYRRSLQPSKENIQYLKTWKFWTFFYFCGSFLPSWIRIPLFEGSSNSN